MQAWHFPSVKRVFGWKLPTICAKFVICCPVDAKRACAVSRKVMPISKRRLNKSDRQARIVAELRAAPTLRVNELSARLGVSAETVRRDLAELDERGLI